MSTMLRVRVSGPLALFTRPEFKAEPVSYPVMTPAAARGILESVFWQPGFAWRILWIDRLRPPRWLSLRRKNRPGPVNPRRVAAMRQGSITPGEWIDECVLRTHQVLADVAYTVAARLEHAEPARAVEGFARTLRRLRRGQHHHGPYLGQREFPATLELLPRDAPDPQSDGQDEDLGMIFLDFDYSVAPPRPAFFAARLEKGRMHVPSLA